MATLDTITAAQLSRLVGTPEAPHILDVRVTEEGVTSSRLLPASSPRDYRSVATWAPEYTDRAVVVVCERGGKLSQGVAAWLRQTGARAEYLEGGFDAWLQAGGLLIRPDHIPLRNAQSKTVWVARSRPKIDRIACPWLIRRFIDPGAVFLFVAQAEVAGVAERFSATPFDFEGNFWSHRGEACTFDVMLKEFGLDSPALARLASIVRGADTARLDIAPEASGLLAASLGLSRMYRNDLAQLDAAMGLYDAFYRWARDAVSEIHT
jgi:rhodanese-related sulfurtransferase